MRGEVYPALYRIEARRAVRLLPDRVARPEAVAEEWALAGDALRLAGNGLGKYGELFAGALGGLAEMTGRESWHPTGAGLIAAYADRLRSGRADAPQADVLFGDAGALLPVYTRLSDAEENERARTGVMGSALPSTGVRGPGAGDVR